MSEERPPAGLDEYRPGRFALLTDRERWPLAGPSDLARLERWRHHDDAPRWTHATGDRLDAAAVARVTVPLSTDGWLEEHLATARRLVRYRGLGPLESLGEFPTSQREDLVRDVSAFVPLDADLSRMLHGSSSGSTGHALTIPDDVEEVARSLHLLRDEVRRAGVEWEPEERRWFLASVVHQRTAYTYVSLISSVDLAVMGRVNLAGDEWRDARAPQRFLAAANPQVISGDPSSLATLLEERFVDVLSPLAVVSGAMHLSAPLRRDLERAYGCPVLDVYGLHETRPIAIRTDDGPFRVLDRRVHVESLDDEGRAVPDGEVGEITVTAGENPLLPLVRYRTGDYGRLLRAADGAMLIADLEGREHTVFRGAGGAPVPCVDLTQQLQAHGARAWSVVQRADDSVEATVVGGDVAAMRAALTWLLTPHPVAVTPVATLQDLGEGKPRRFVVEGR